MTYRKCKICGRDTPEVELMQKSKQTKSGMRVRTECRECGVRRQRTREYKKALKEGRLDALIEKTKRNLAHMFEVQEEGGKLDEHQSE